jgi:hypothetical protein
MRIVHAESSLGWGAQESRIHSAAADRQVAAIAVPIARKRPRAIRALPLGLHARHRSHRHHERAAREGAGGAQRLSGGAHRHVPSGIDPQSHEAMLDAMERIYREASGRASVSFSPPSSDTRP